MSDQKCYNIMPACKKAVYEEERYINVLSSSKKVVVTRTLFYRNGSFTIHLTEEEKNDIMQKDRIVLSDYEFEFNSLYDGCEQYIVVENEESYSKDELREIMESICEDPESCNAIFMEENGWDLTETLYGFQCGCILEDVDECC